PIWCSRAGKAEIKAEGCRFLFLRNPCPCTFVVLIAFSNENPLYCNPLLHVFSLSVCPWQILCSISAYMFPICCRVFFLLLLGHYSSYTNWHNCADINLYD